MFLFVCFVLFFHTHQLPNRPNGNFLAVGTFLPIIEIWDLDVVDDIQPSATLGSVPRPPEKKMKKNKKKKAAMGKAEDKDTHKG